MEDNKTLNDVILELKQISESSKKTSDSVNDLTKSVNNFMNYIERKDDQDRLKAEELRRENMNVPGKSPELSIPLVDAFKAGIAAGAGFELLQLTPRNVMKLLSLGGLAVGSGFLGLRALDITIAEQISKSVFKILGLTKTGNIPDPKLPKITVVSRIITAFEKLEARILKFFGLNVKGVQIRDSLGRFTNQFSRVSVTQRIADTIGKLLSPIRILLTGINDYLIGPGAKLFGFLSNVMGITKLGFVAGKMFNVFKKILWPVSILFAAYDGIKEFINKEGTVLEKTIAGIGGFVGDFIGAPLDLINKLIALGLEKIGLIDIAKTIREFSLEEKIKEFARSPLEFVQRFTTYIKVNFFDPTISVITKLSIDISSMVTKFKDGFSDFIQAIIDIPKRLTEWILESFTKNDFQYQTPYQIGVGPTNRALGLITIPTFDENKTIQYIQNIEKQRAKQLDNALSNIQPNNQTIIVAPNNSTSNNIQQNTSNMIMLPSPYNQYEPKF